MICQVIVNDFEIGQRILYILDDGDFEAQRGRWKDTDDVLLALQNTDMFASRTRWMDLEIRHFHVMIVNILKILSGADDAVRSDKDNPMVARLAFFLCGIISLIQENGCNIELFRINRVSSDDVLYDYSATLDVKIDLGSKNGFKVVIDNEGK
jgi:hypothetical protein